MTKLMAVIIVSLAFILVFYLGCQKGKQSQIKDNINKGVMNKGGSWVDGFELAKK